jgi:hypothetical protein
MVNEYVGNSPLGPRACLTCSEVGVEDIVDTWKGNKKKKES